MNRRSFLAAAVSAALVPKELIKPVFIPFLEPSELSKGLAASMLATKEAVAAKR
jgi:hypothetical protein